jgi:hypothetical protein
MELGYYTNLQCYHFVDDPLQYHFMTCMLKGKPNSRVLTDVLHYLHYSLGYMDHLHVK